MNSCDIGTSTGTNQNTGTGVGRTRNEMKYKTEKQTYFLLCETYGKEEMKKLIGLSRFVSETKKHGSIIKEVKQYFETK